MKTHKFGNSMRFENASHTFLNLLLMTMAFKVAIGAFLTAINKRLCFEKGLNNIVLLEQCEHLFFHFIAYSFENGAV